MLSINQLRLRVLVVLFLLASNLLRAQTTWDTLPWKSYSDFKLQNLDKSFVTSNILYDRVFPLANVDEYTGLPAYSNTDTTHPDHWMQAYYEIYNSAYNNAGWTNPDDLDSIIKANGAINEHPIGVFYYTFNTLDTNALQDHLVDTLSNGQFVDVANRPRSPYFTNTSFLASPLIAEDQVAEQGDHLFYIDSKFFLHNEYLNVTQIRVDFGDGQGEWVVDNPFNGSGGRTTGFVNSILKHLTGTIVGRIVVVGIDVLGQTISHGSPFKLFVKSKKQYQPLTTCKGLQQWVIEAPQSRLDPINAQYGNPQLDYRNQDGSIRKDTAYFYFAGNGSSCSTGLLQRPIVFIDGFDPTNSRGVQQIYEDYINVNVLRNNQQVKFGDYMLGQGYDFVILDFKHGNDLLERNAMTLVSLLERLNQTYGSTMQQGITLIGPSMGSLIAQYALAYMEHNNIPHNVKTYISFDGCHQGANVPIGLQEFVEYFTRKGIFKKKEIIREGLYNGLAARQMLAHHVSANSHFPAPDALRNTFLQNLAAVGEYPQQCRKVALIDGSSAGIINGYHPNPSETLLHIAVKRKGWKSLWGSCSDNICEKLDWNCYTSPNSGTAKVMENWTVEPIFNLLFWAPLGKTNKYADAAWGNSSLDNAPGGTFGTLFGTEPGDIKESNFVFLLKEAMYLITGSKRTTFSQNINQFTMMPSYSAADLRFPTMTDNSAKNLYMRFDNQYLCGHTPFDYVYAPKANPSNQEHVNVYAEASQWFENEVKCNIGDLPTFYNPQIVGNSALCGNSGIYSIQTCNNSPLNVTWNVVPSGIVTPVSNGSSVTLNKISNGVVTLTATNNSTCQDGFTLTKQITVGLPVLSSAQYTYNGTQNPLQFYTGSSSYNPLCVSQTTDVNATFTGANSVTWSKVSSSNTVSWSQNGNDLNFYLWAAGQTAVFNVQATNGCGNTSYTFGFQAVDCGGGGGGGCAKYSVANTSHSSIRVVVPNIPSPCRVAVTKKDSSDKDVIALVKVYDAGGKMLINRNFTNARMADISSDLLIPGVYIIEISDGKNIERQKVVVLK